MKQITAKISSAMKRALELASGYEGLTHPNPMVGAVVLDRRGHMVGEGAHQGPGTPHAESIALGRAGDKAKGGTLVVTLEPCSHHGRTPPCVEAIFHARIARVVAAMPDPNPKENGRGFQWLKEHTIDVNVGLQKESAQALNKAYFRAMQEGLPWIKLKMGASLDGKLATRTGESKYITSSESQRLVHHWRFLSDAILTTASTVLADNPLLDARMERRGKAISRWVLDRRGRLSGKEKLWTTREAGPIHWVTNPDIASPPWLPPGGIHHTCPTIEGGLDLQATLALMVKHDIFSVLTEHGGTLAWSLLAQGLIQEVGFFLAPKILGGSSAPTVVDGEGVGALAEAISLDNLQSRIVGKDLLVEGLCSQD